MFSAHTIAAGVLASCTFAYPASLGSHTPAFSVTTISLVHNSALLVSMMLALLTLLCAKTRESKLY